MSSTVKLECGGTEVVHDENPIGYTYLCRTHDPDTVVPLLHPTRLYRHISRAVEVVSGPLDPALIDRIDGWAAEDLPRDELDVN